MNAFSTLIRDMHTAPEGSRELDQRIIDIIRPGRQVFGPLSHHTRSLDAKLPGEDIYRVERLSWHENERWRAWLSNDWSADANTEILARRLACLSYGQFEEKDNKPQDRQAKRKEYAAPYRISTGDLENAPDSSLVGCDYLMGLNGNPNDRVIIAALCEHISRLERTKHASIPNLPLFPEAFSGQAKITVVNDQKNPPAITSDGAKSTTTMSEALTAWKIDARPRMKNMDRVSRAIRRFTDLYGDRPLNSYTKAEVRDFLHHIQRLPKHAPKTIYGMPMSVWLEFAEQNPEAECVTPRTVGTHLKDLGMLFTWAVAADLCAQNPTSALRVIDRRLQSEIRLPYDTDELKLFFEQAPLFRGCRAAHRRRIPGKKIIKDSIFWFPLFALYSGARLGEIASTTVDDFRFDQGCHYLDIHAAKENRHLKTQGSDRRIPIHPELIKMGFLRYLEKQRKAGATRVFERNEGRPDIRAAHGWSQFWRDFQRELGLTDRRKVFHSFRHNFKGACRDAGIEEEVHDAITGHRPYMAGRRYGWRISLTVLDEAMAKVHYAGLDLSHLHEQSRNADNKS